MGSMYQGFTIVSNPLPKLEGFCLWYTPGLLATVMTSTTHNGRNSHGIFVQNPHDLAQRQNAEPSPNYFKPVIHEATKLQALYDSSSSEDLEKARVRLTSCRSLAEL